MRAREVSRSSIVRAGRQTQVFQEVNQTGFAVIVGGLYSYHHKSSRSEVHVRNSPREIRVVRVVLEKGLEKGRLRPELSLAGPCEPCESIACCFS